VRKNIPKKTSISNLWRVLDGGMLMKKTPKGLIATRDIGAHMSIT